LIFADNWGSKSSLSLEHQGNWKINDSFWVLFFNFKARNCPWLQNHLKKKPRRRRREEESIKKEMQRLLSLRNASSNLPKKLPNNSSLLPSQPSQNQPTITKTRIFHPKLFMGFSRSSFCPFYQTPISGFQPKVSQNAKLASLYVGLREVALAGNLLILWYCCCLVFEKT